jgi:hypothetical protein
LLAACSNQKTAAAPYAFSRPEHLGFVCLDPDGNATKAHAENEKQKDPKYPDDPAKETYSRPFVLPLACCGLLPTLESDDSNLSYESCPDQLRTLIRANKATPTLHALITQSTRGEVAAVDLVASRVIDSDVLIPGYTFVDVGGLPSAIVIPTTRPLFTSTDDHDIKTQGPPWTYIASAEELHVRAVATCRFHSSVVCGPEEGVNDLSLLKVPLPAAPRDMVFADDALWVTMPDLGLMARIDLSSKWEAPFKLGANGKPAAPTFFALAPIGQVSPEPAIAEADVYRTSCGLGYTPADGLEYLTLPLAPEAKVEGKPAPTKLRYSAEDKLLFVADQHHPVLRAFSIDESKNLVPSGLLPTGAPVRDFALTPEVPVLEGSEPFQYMEQLPDPDAPTRRYLYGLDDRDGSLFVHIFSHDAAGVSSQPLLVPNARRFGDRVELGGTGLALDVVDTRALSASYCGQVDAESREILPVSVDKPGQNPEQTPNYQYYKNTLTTARDAARTARNKAKGAQVAPAQTALNQAQARLDIASNAGPYQLRGVFVAVTSTDAGLRIIDVHDLDAPCREQNSCTLCTDPKSCGPNNPTRLVNDSDVPVTVRRHALRQDVRDNLTASFSDDKAFDGLTCPENYRSVLGKNTMKGMVDVLCVPNDTRRTRTDSWLVAPSGVLPNAALLEGYLVREDDGTVTLWGDGRDFCARGIEYNGMPGRDPELGATTDSVTLRIASTVKDCAPLDPDFPIFLPIVEAYTDHLVLDGSDANVKEALRCYPDTLLYDVRATGQFLVTSSGFPLEHRVVAADDGRCVIDTTKDPLLHGRIARKQPDPANSDAPLFDTFTNAFVSFRLANGVSDNLNTIPRIDLTITSNVVENATFDPAQGRRDALPVTVQYFPYTDNLFVVDSASQGMRIFKLSPFLPTNTSFR